MGILICQADATVVLCATWEILTITETLTAVGKCSDHLLSGMDWMVQTMANEKRLIDANALIKEANAEGAYGYVDAKQIADAPTVDAVEVLRCRECKYWGDEDGKLQRLDGVLFARCKVHNYLIDGRHTGWCPTENDFCSYGERKEGAD